MLITHAVIHAHDGFILMKPTLGNLAAKGSDVALQLTEHPVLGLFASNSFAGGKLCTAKGHLLSVPLGSKLLIFAVPLGSKASLFCLILQHILAVFSLSLSLLILEFVGGGKANLLGLALGLLLSVLIHLAHDHLLEPGLGHVPLRQHLHGSIGILGGN